MNEKANKKLHELDMKPQNKSILNLPIMPKAPDY